MIVVRNLIKEFPGEIRAVDDISFEVPAGGLVTLLGPSGCGKTTTLRSIAGLESPTGGEIRIGDQVVYSRQRNIVLPANRRNIGMVFQSYAIWPHMTVFDNVAYPLKNTGVSKSDIQERVRRALALTGLEAFAARPAPHLSGGQQQRVALARALVAEPDVLLLDEPLSNLDAKLRESMRGELRDLQQRLRITTLYVTHDQSEALAISDFVAVMSRGKIVEFGPPEQIYENPRSRFAAEFVGVANLIAVTDVKLRQTQGEGKGSMGLVRFVAAYHGNDTSLISSRETQLLVRPEDVEIRRSLGGGDANEWPGLVRGVLFEGDAYSCVVELNGLSLRTRTARAIRPRPGEQIYVRIPPECCVPILEDIHASGHQPDCGEGTKGTEGTGSPTSR
jgi:iron(III) transport system ATP-binding protein